MTNISDQEIRNWLLRRLDAQHNATIEQQLFADAGLADRIDEVECDLIDDYVRGRLPADDARVVRTHDAWRIRFAKAFIELQRPTVALASRRARTSSLRRVGLGTAIAASALFAVVAFRWQAIAPMPTEQTANTASLPVVTLLVEQRRGATTPLKLPAHDGDVRVQAEIVDDSTEASSRYVFSVVEGGRVLFVAHGLAARNVGPYRFVEVVMPTSVLGGEVRRIAVAKEGTQDSAAESWDVQMPASR